jgi:hypothetical protein
MKPHPIAPAVAAALVLNLWGASPAMARVEEPPHVVLVREGAFEVRDYAPQVVAETRVPEGRGDPANAGFRPLADYIFGANAPKARIAMTAPVTTRAAGQATGGRGGEKIAMTAPVTTRSGGDGHVVAFIMPAAARLATMPAPTDPAVRLREEPARRFAVTRFGGFTGAATVAARTRDLRGFIARRGLVPTGAPPILARYDPPWTLPPLRRNEVWIEVFK